MMPSTAHCPACGGDIHPLAGRCKHCKADLGRLREREAEAKQVVRRASDESGPNQALAMLATPPPSRHQPDRPTPAAPPAAAPPPVVQAPAPVPPAPAPVPQAAPSYPSQPHPAPVPQTAPTYQSQPHPAPHGYAPSTWSRRWPLAVGAIALLAIGISLGILIERSRQSSPEPVRSRSSASSPRPTLDNMPDPVQP